MVPRPRTGLGTRGFSVLYTCFLSIRGEPLFTRYLPSFIIKTGKSELLFLLGSFCCFLMAVVTKKVTIDGSGPFTR